MSDKLPAITSKKLIKILKGLGFELYRREGRHQIYVKEEKQVIVPYHNKDIKKGTLTQIIKGTGLSKEEFKKLI